MFSSIASSTSLSGDLILAEDGLVVFPPPSVHASLVLAGGADADAEAPWGSGGGDLDGGGGWGAASRSSLTVKGRFLWRAGAISGNARVRNEHPTARDQTSTLGEKKYFCVQLYPLSRNKGRGGGGGACFFFVILPSKARAPDNRTVEAGR